MNSVVARLGLPVIVGTALLGLGFFRLLRRMPQGFAYPTSSSLKLGSGIVDRGGGATFSRFMAGGLRRGLGGCLGMGLGRIEDFSILIGIGFDSVLVGLGLRILPSFPSLGLTILDVVSTFFLFAGVAFPFPFAGCLGIAFRLVVELSRSMIPGLSLILFRWFLKFPGALSLPPSLPSGSMTLYASFTFLLVPPLTVFPGLLERWARCLAWIVLSFAVVRKVLIVAVPVPFPLPTGAPSILLPSLSLASSFEAAASLAFVVCRVSL